MHPKTLFNITLPWNPSNSDEGDYSTCLYAKDDMEAVYLTAIEMSNCGEKFFSDENERLEYINILVQNGGYVADAKADLGAKLGKVFELQLFPDGVKHGIDMEALGLILAENRDRLLIQPAAIAR